MTTRAFARDDIEMGGVRIAVVRETNGTRTALTWQPQTARVLIEDAAEHPEDWLRLHEDDARAIYEALAEHFGHTGHDIRSLRRDYDTERRRVDQFIEHLTKSTR